MGKNTDKQHVFHATPKKIKTIDIVDETKGPIMQVVSTKKQFVEEFKEEEKKQVDEVNRAA